MRIVDDAKAGRVRAVVVVTGGALAVWNHFRVHSLPGADHVRSVRVEVDELPLGHPAVPEASAPQDVDHVLSVAAEHGVGQTAGGDTSSCVDGTCIRLSIVRTIQGPFTAAKLLARISIGTATGTQAEASLTDLLGAFGALDGDERIAMVTLPLSGPAEVVKVFLTRNLGRALGFTIETGAEPAQSPLRMSACHRTLVDRRAIRESLIGASAAKSYGPAHREGGRRPGEE